MFRARELYLCCTCAACVSVPAGTDAGIQVAHPFVGVTHYQIVKAYNEPAGSPTASLPRELFINLIEIDVTAPGVQFRMQPGNGPLPGEVTRSTTRNFVNSIGAQIGINGDFYDTNPPYPPQGGNFFTDVVHAGASEGDVYSPNNGGESIFNISATNDARIVRGNGPGTTTTQEGVALYNAIGGNQRILTAGVITAPNDSYTNTLNPHTAIAVSQDRRKVFLMTVDGRQGNFSGGMRTTEMASLFLQYGGWDAINLDGGGSTTLVFDDTNDGIANARIINSPSDGATPQQPGNERLVANNLAVFAVHNPAYVPIPPPPRPPAVPALPVLPQLTVFDDFEGTRGRFSSAVNASGSSFNISPASASAVDTAFKHRGSSSLRVDIVNTNATPARMQLRLLSGGGNPTNNTVDGSAAGPDGYVGFFLRVAPGSDPLWASILIDDGTTSANGLERAAMLPVIADGQFHLYQWNLADPEVWFNFSGGNGTIDGPNAFIDAIYLSSAPGTSGGTNWSGSVWIDVVAYNPEGRLDILIPEPASAAVAGAILGLLCCRRRSRCVRRMDNLGLRIRRVG
ncbi:MAG: phosphodiester glycosidase family protein [Phycisphaerales bacterium]|nr:phosphodiester glycosidase family protein [Phycisphaerales bacterium]